MCEDRFTRRNALGMFATLAAVSSLGLPATALARNTSSSEYSAQEIVDAGHNFFDSTSGGLAKVVEKAFQRYGLPNGYILIFQ